MHIQAKNLKKKFGKKVAVKNISIDIIPGQILGLLGPNGAGKSTTIGMLTAQIKPDAGKIIVDGKKYSSLDRSQIGQVGIMPQETILWDELTIAENLIFTGRLYHLSNSDIAARAEKLISDLQLTKEQDTQARHLSGGYKRRLNLAMALMHDPQVLFLDEPSPGVDAQTRRFLWQFIQDLKDKHRAIVLTDHYLEEAEQLSDYVVIIDEGIVVTEGTVDEIKHEYHQAKVHLKRESTGPSLEDVFLHITGHTIRE